MDYFDFREIKKNDPRIAEIYRLRYKVYVEEWGFERPEDHPLGIETDAYDLQAVQIGAFRRETGAIIGTGRLIPYAEALGFPIQKNMRMDRAIPPELLKTACEISRLAVSKEYRRRAGDNLMYSESAFLPTATAGVESERRDSENDIVLGIIRKICEYSGREGFTHWSVGMAKGLYVLLKRRKIVFEPIGPEIDYHGLRRPYFGRVEEILGGNDELLTIYQRALALRTCTLPQRELPVAI
ncbi:PEP-CTERM/exosortase system-associated acyltransferase [Geoalkalibacter sp.]|uniref:PEP-CTERM/exosortase system-associated acyltransferase n=1 Tax=Geoalkalibacter sp. TaxID=3041440 RepID=UPI00272E2378|nr:PEP-CTERM/exosortase system-associated acyltransferase [Geoalkalibacter sp.]